MKNPQETFTRLYRYMLREDIYFAAYQNLYANNGAATKGINDDTADGFSEKYIANIIGQLQAGTYKPQPVRRVYIEKANGKMRPLGIPTFTDKLIQEVLRMILEAVYEPIFSNASHGFRPNRGCHTALMTIQKEWNGALWFIEGDITGCFDHIDHQRLIQIIEQKIKDARLTQLIYKFLKAGYIENWKYNNTYSGTPQGGIVSPILANIYLNELDKFVETLKINFDAPAERKFTPEYKLINQHVYRLRKKIDKASDEEKPALIAQLKLERARMLKTPSKSQTDKKLKYIRYADDFLIAVYGSKEDCENIKSQLKTFISEQLMMELSEEKTLITHSTQKARFLGYDICVLRKDNLMRVKGKTKRSKNHRINLSIPLCDKINSFMFKNHVIRQKGNKIIPSKRDVLTTLSDLEIVAAYNAEMRGICNYYSLASNYYRLNYFSYLMEYSCLMTFACKYRTTISHIMKKFSDGNGRWCIPYETKKGKKRMYFTRSNQIRKPVVFDDTISNIPTQYLHSKNTLENRLKAHVCEICGSVDSDRYEVHHINKVKNLKGKDLWERIMLAKRRKTLVVCEDCHYKIHKRTKAQ